MNYHLPSHAQMIDWIPLHSVAARIEKLSGHAEDGAPVVEQGTGDQVRRLAGAGSHPDSDLANRRAVSVGLERGDSSVDKGFDQIGDCGCRSFRGVAEGEEDRKRGCGGG